MTGAPARVTRWSTGSRTTSPQIELRRGPAGVAARDRADARVQLVEVERLDEIVVGAGVEAGDAIAARVARRQHDHRGPVLARPQGTQDVEAVARDARPRARRVPGRQAEVEEDEIEALAGERAVGGGRIAHPVDRMALEAKRPLQALADHAVVLDQKQAHQPA